MLVRSHIKAQPVAEVVIEEEEEEVERKTKGTIDEGERISALDEEHEMRDKEFQCSLNSWRGRMRKQFWWTMTDDSDEVGDPALVEWMHQRRNELHFTTMMIVDTVS
jgi:hypothetical protein